MSVGRVIFLNYPLVAGGNLGDAPLPRDYMLACRFLHCSILDRTATLDTGFDYAVLDTLPAPGIDATFAELSDAIGDEIVREAMRAERDVRVFWSGGIDSTTALVAVLKAATSHGYTHRVRVLLTLASVHEYPHFFLAHIHERIAIEAIREPVSAHIDPHALNVTGEHGDQLFGSQLLRTYVQRGFGDVDYRDILPFVLLERLRGPWAARSVHRYLLPVILAAPVQIRTLFDCLWWLNFTLKWQAVSLRLFSSCEGDAAPLHGSTRHFFRDERFQAWALAVHSDDRCPGAWERYKDVAKAYIRAYTADLEYFRTKEKEDSLRNIMPRSTSGEPVGVYMGEDFRPVVIPVANPAYA